MKLDDLVEVIGEEAAWKLCEHWGGESHWIPAVVKCDKVERNEKIRERRRQGVNLKSLAKMWGLDISTVSRICEGIKIQAVYDSTFEEIFKREHLYECGRLISSKEKSE